MVKINPNEKRPSRTEVTELEKVIGLTLPQEYIKFLENYNGGQPETNIVEMDDTEIKSFSITSFYGFGLVSYEDIWKNINTFKGRIPEKCIPIASVDGGNILVMSLDLKKYGQIFLWDHEEEFEYESSGNKIDDLCYVASSLNELFNMTKSYYTRNIDLGGRVRNVWVNPEFLKKFQKESGEK